MLGQEPVVCFAKLDYGSFGQNNMHLPLISAQTNQKGLKCITTEADNAQSKKELPYAMKCKIKWLFHNSCWTRFLIITRLSDFLNWFIN